MKQKYLLVRSATKFNADTVLFYLFVGTSSRDQVCKTLVECFCNDIGAFFRIADEDTDYWLLQKAQEMRPDSQFPLLWLKSTTMDIRKFYRKLMESNLDVMESQVKTSSTAIQQLSMLDANYFSRRIREKTIPRANPSRRKNLSDSLQDDMKKAAFCFAVVLGIFLIDGIVSFIFGI